MFLKSLSMKGFKSFADPTVLEFEPGITVVVGPNGSGKSNVVDAVTWVLGAQGPRSLRSAKMEDVIFAGTSSRPALGRAEVSLTIDNASGKLPVDLAEVTITRTLFRSGDSEYAINGAPCRLLDIQELLSDSGVGRQQHMIIGQGQLDTVLNARPEDRRAIIEEAAGVLKHRRRRERAERRLAGTAENLERLGDLVREVRRQIRPLERQAAAARSHATMAAELLAVRRYLAGAELAELDAGAAGRRPRTCASATTRSASCTPPSRCSRPRPPRPRPSCRRGARRTWPRALAGCRAWSSGPGARRACSGSGAGPWWRRSTPRPTSTWSRPSRPRRPAWRARWPTRPTSEAGLEPERGRTGPRTRRARGRGSGAPPSAGPTAGRATRPKRPLAKVRGAGIEPASAGPSGGSARTWPASTSGWPRWSSATAAAAVKADLLADDAAELEAEAGAAGGGRPGGRHGRPRGRRPGGPTAAEAGGRRGRAGAAPQRGPGRSARPGPAGPPGGRGRELLAGVDGVVGSLVDLVEIDEGWEAAFEAAAGAGVAAVVVDGRRSAQQALATFRERGATGAVLAPGAPAPTPIERGRPAVAGPAAGRRAGAPPRPGPPGAMPSTESVLDALVGRAVRVDGWEEAIDLSLSPRRPGRGHPRGRPLRRLGVAGALGDRRGHRGRGARRPSTGPTRRRRPPTPPGPAWHWHDRTGPGPRRPGAAAAREADRQAALRASTAAETERIAEEQRRLTEELEAVRAGPVEAAARRMAEAQVEVDACSAALPRLEEAAAAWQVLSERRAGRRWPCSRS